MYKCTPQEIIAAVPGVQTVHLDALWFHNLDQKKPVFESLYDWMTESGRIPNENHKTLHNRTYVSDKVFKKLLAAEKKRIQKKHRLKGGDLEEAVKWSDLASGPRSEVGGCRITGEIILVIPEDSSEALSEFSIQLLSKIREKHINKVKANAAGADFYGWLVSQVKRPDRVGDLARDADNCQEFPRALQDYEDYLVFAQKTGFCDAAIGSLNEAWLEYARQYPERISPAAWCSECGKRISVDAAQFSWDEDSGEVFILDAKCIEKYQGFSPMKSIPLAGISRDNLSEVMDQNELSEWDMDRAVEKLLLWGILPQDDNGTIYFFECETTREIKIGITSGRVEKRMATVQTARGHKLSVLATIPGTTKFERALHERFAQHRLKGEWFRPHPDILEYIAQLQGDRT
jgi:uncharacterized protein YozE (UPF0346 family)